MIYCWIFNFLSFVLGGIVKHNISIKVTKMMQSYKATKCDQYFSVLQVSSSHTNTSFQLYTCANNDNYIPLTELIQCYYNMLYGKNWPYYYTPNYCRSMHICSSAYGTWFPPNDSGGFLDFKQWCRTELSQLSSPRTVFPPSSAGLWEQETVTSRTMLEVNSSGYWFSGTN